MGAQVSGALHLPSQAASLWGRTQTHPVLPLLVFISTHPKSGNPRTLAEPPQMRVGPRMWAPVLVHLSHRSG